MSRSREDWLAQAPTKWSEGEARKALRSLSDALEYVGVVLPSLSVDVASLQMEAPLIDLGRARPDVIEELAEVIRRGAHHG